MKTKLNAKIHDVAFALGQSIMEAEKVPIPDEVKLTDIIRGKVQIPDVLLDFFIVLIGGPDQRVAKSR